MFTRGVVLTFKGAGIHFGKRESHISLLLLNLMML